MDDSNLIFRFAEETDTPIILSFIQALADYEQMLDQVVATETMLRKYLFKEKRAEVLIGEKDGIPFGFALFFYNFSTFLGRSGIYLEDLYVKHEERGKGYGKLFMKKLASIAVERDCGRFEWACLDWNKPSIDFYLSLGAQPLKDWTVYRLSGKELLDLAK